MTVELLQTLSLISYILAGVFLILAIALFFVLDVRKLIGDISGANARRAIENIRQQNESSGDKAYKPSPVNQARGRLTDKISQSGRLEPRVSGMGGSPGTEKFSTTKLMPQAEETTILSTAASETTILSEGAMTVGETTVLSQVGIPVDIPMDVMPTADSGNEGFTIDVEMDFTGSSEIIE